MPHKPFQEDDSIETVVGPSVHVEGNFESKGNIIVKGSVAGTVKTSRHLRVEEGATLVANVEAESAEVAGSIKGNVKVAGIIELTSSAKIKGDVQAGTLVIASGAALHGKCSMPKADFSLFEEFETAALKNKKETKSSKLIPAEEAASA